jgi:hypothetical protein
VPGLAFVRSRATSGAGAARSGHRVTPDW